MRQSDLVIAVVDSHTYIDSAIFRLFAGPISVEGVTESLVSLVEDSRPIALHAVEGGEGEFRRNPDRSYVSVCIEWEPGRIGSDLWFSERGPSVVFSVQVSEIRKSEEELEFLGFLNRHMGPVDLRSEQF